MDCTLPTRAVKAFIVKEGKILLLQRNKALRGKDNWDLPGGLVEKGQSEIDALHREVQEELGISVVIKGVIGSWEFLRDKDQEKVSVSNYICHVLEDDQDIKLSEEHSDYKWIEPGDIAEFEVKDQSLIDLTLKTFSKQD